MYLIVPALVITISCTALEFVVGVDLIAVATWLLAESAFDFATTATDKACDAELAFTITADDAADALSQVPDLAVTLDSALEPSAAFDIASEAAALANVALLKASLAELALTITAELAALALSHVPDLFVIFDRAFEPSAAATLAADAVFEAAFATDKAFEAAALATAAALAASLAAD